jgi:hypothetical protein
MNQENVIFSKRQVGVNLCLYIPCQRISENSKCMHYALDYSVGSIEETKPLDVTCTTTGSRPRATLQWTIGQKDVTSNATEQFNHTTASDTYTVISDLIYSVGKSDNGQMLTCKAVNVCTIPKQNTY